MTIFSARISASFVSIHDIIKKTVNQNVFKIFIKALKKSLYDTMIKINAQSKSNPLHFLKISKFLDIVKLFTERGKDSMDKKTSKVWHIPVKSMYDAMNITMNIPVTYSNH